MEFKKFRDAVEAQFNKMAKGDLFVVNVERDMVWEAYMEAFPAGTNEIYRERREYDCNTCKSFIRRIGNVVAVIDGKIVTVWDVEAEGYYKDVTAEMARFVRDYEIADIFLHNEPKVGQFETKSIYEATGNIEKWNHFSCNLPSKFVSDDVAAIKGKVRQNVQVFKRGLDELSLGAIEIVTDLIIQNSLYRGEEFRDNVSEFATLKEAYDKIESETAKTIYAWQNVRKRGSLFRNSVIGTLVIDLSEGVDINSAVASFEAKVAPTNYKRTTAPVTKGMVKQAVDKIDELGLEPYLHRRYAHLSDISINNVLFADRSSSALMKDSLTDMLMSEVKETPTSFDKVEEIGIEEFLARIVPEAESIEVMFDGKHINNLVSLVAPEVDGGEKLFKWDNPFSWSYNGNIADSGIKERVKSAGGDIGGVLRVSLAWHNSDDLDIHIVEPGGNKIYYSNKRNDATSGKLDVDMNAGGNMNSTDPVENITWTEEGRMQKGLYKVLVNQYSQRNSSDVGFVLEVEYNGQISHFAYDRTVTGTVPAFGIDYDGKSIKFVGINDNITTSLRSQNVWKVDTEKMQKVSTVLMSPNHWDDQEVGNKHYFFMLDGCENPDRTRGMYNEFLRNDLTEHRKVFEVLADKMKCDHTHDQLSGLGFSSTKRDEIVCKVNGSFSRMMKVKF